MQLTRSGSVFVLDLGDDENRLNPDSCAAWGAALDEVEATEGTALVTTGSGKQYSSGLDLPWAQANPDGFVPMLAAVHRLLARLLALPVYSVAALNGHTFAAGAMVAAAHDQRVMREDRGWWCLPEVALGMPFTPGMTALLTARLGLPAFHRAAVTGDRYVAAEAVALGAVDEAVPAERVLARAVELAEARAAVPRQALKNVKDSLYREQVAVLLADAEGGATLG